MKLEDEVVLVTDERGNGLGRLLAEMYAMKEIRRVAVFKCKVSMKEKAEREDEKKERNRWFKCDVKIREKIK